VIDTCRVDLSVGQEAGSRGVVQVIAAQLAVRGRQIRPPAQ
jgi:hypothetical protein